MKSGDKKAIIDSPVRVPRKIGGNLFKTQTSNKNAIAATHSAVNHRESSSRYELYEETNEALLDSKERVMVNSGGQSPKNVDVASKLSSSI